MSAETTTWLNTNTLIGMTDQRGLAWHYRAEEQGDESNHYPGAIPIKDIRRRLFDWQGVPRRVAVEKPADLETATHFGEDGSPMRWVVETNRQAITASDNDDTLGLFKDGYAGHQYDEWLLEEVAELLVGNPLVASSAGLLRNRGLAWVEVSVPENRTVCGVEFRPNLVAATSFDGSLSTTYKRTVTACVCDNTLRAALGERGSPTLKFKHSKNSGFRRGEARQALAIIDSTGEEFEKTVRRLTGAKVSDLQFREVLNVLVPVGDDASKQAKTMGTNKRNALTTMWVSDERVAPWTGTAFGVVQAFNTWEQHERPTRGGTQRAERNMLDALNGNVDKFDAEVLAALHGLQLV